MKRYFSASVSILLFFLMLLFPELVFQGSSNGLLLWFRTVLPTLLPFFIASNFLLRTDAALWLSRLAFPVLGRFFHVSLYGSFAMITGFFCGCPMGAKVTADLLDKQRISLQEGKYLLSFCNNTSPGFIVSFLVFQCLQTPSLAVPSLMLILGVPLLCSLFFRKFLHISSPRFDSHMPASRNSGSSLPDSLIDTCIMDAIENITRIGGYIMLFSILFTLLSSLSWLPLLFQVLLIPSMEMTNGVIYLCSLDLSPVACYTAVMFLTSFGGLCCVAQTASVIRKTDLKIFPYIAEKLATAVVTSLISCLFFTFIFKN